MSQVGQVSIGIRGDSSAFQAELKRAAQFSQQAGASISAALATVNGASNGLDGTTKSLEALRTSLDRAGTAAKTNADSIGGSTSAISEHFKSAAAAVGVFVVAKQGLVELGSVLQKLTGAAQGQSLSFGAMADSAVNFYRVARIALSPTLFTVASVGAGVLLEKLASITNEEGKQLELESRIAAQRGLRPADVSAIDLTTAKGQNPSDFFALAKAAVDAKEKVQEVLGVHTTGRPADDLRAIASALAAIKDPYDKAAAAQKIFGGDADKALTLLNSRFAENSQRVRDWGLVYSVETRANILTFRQDLESLQHPFQSLGDSIHATVQQAKGELSEFFAYVYTQFKSGAIQGAILAPFNLGEYVPEGAREAAASGSSALGGFAASFGAANRFHNPLSAYAPDRGFLDRADAQFARELQDTIGGVNRRAKPSGDIGPESASDIAAVNGQAAGAEGLRQKLGELQHRRSQIIGQYYQVGSSGALEFKDDLSSAQKASANASLLATNGGIGNTNALIAKAESDAQASERATVEAATAARNRSGRFNSLLAEARQSELESNSAGQSVASPYAKAAGETERQIASLNNELARNGQTLSLSERYYIRAIENTIALNNADKEWKDNIAGISGSLETQAKSQEILTAAIGKGAAATRQAAIESQLVNALGPRYNEAGRASETDELRKRFGAEYDSRQRNASAASVDSLRQETDAQLRLTVAQTQGAEAVRREGIEIEVAALARRGATEEEQAAYRARANAQRGNESAQNLAALQSELSATQRLTAAQVGGEDAIRRADLATRLAAAERAGASAAELAAMRELDAEQDRQGKVSEAARRLNAAGDEIMSLREQLAIVRRVEAAEGDTLRVRVALKEVTAEISRIQNQQVLAVGSATQGMKVLFREMVTESQSAAQQVHDVMQSAFNGVNDNLAKMISGQKASWSSFFQSLSEQLARMALQTAETAAVKKLGGILTGTGGGQSGAQSGGVLGTIGGVLGKVMGGLPAGKHDGSTPDSALYVQIVGPGPTTAGGAAPWSIPGISTGGSASSDQPWSEQIPGMGGGSSQSSSGGLLGSLGGLFSGLFHGQSSRKKFLDSQNEVDRDGEAWVRNSSGLFVPKNGYGDSSSDGADFFSSVSSLFGSGGDSGVGDGSGGFFGSVSKLFGGGDDSGGGGIDWSQLFGGFRAAGGDVDPGKAYVVGENGPELFRPPSGGSIVPNHKLGGSTHYYTIDSRGTDPVQSEQRTRAAIIAAHNSAVKTSQQISAEQVKRTPQK